MTVPGALQAVLPSGVLEQPPNDGATGLERKPVGERQLRRWSSTRFVPFDYQLDVISGLAERASIAPVVGMLMMPTGSGKTATAVAYILDQLCATRTENAICLWIAPQHELLAQAAATFESIWASGYGPNSLDLSMVSGTSSSPPSGRATVLFATPMMAKRQVHGSAVCKRVSHLIFDEAHHLGAQRFGGSWREIIDASPVIKTAIGLSATPTRGDSESFDDLQLALDSRLFYPKRLLPDPVVELVDRGVLAKISIERVPNIPLRSCGPGLTVRDANRALVSDPDYWLCCIECAAGFGAPCIVYCVDRQTGRLFAQHLRVLGVRAEFIDGNDSYDVRVSALERFRDGRTTVLVSVHLLFEGVDAPSAAGAMITYRIQSTIRLAQIVGRVMRGSRLGGTANATVLCADAVVERELRLNGVSRDYGAYWSRGIAL